MTRLATARVFRRRGIRRALWVMLVGLLHPSVTFAQRTIYVNLSAAGANDGSSWKDAFIDLHDALDAARASGDFDAEIWIAKGVYKPDRGTGDRTSAYELFGNIALYGGFGGWEECREERDWVNNETILDGDLLDDDDPTITSTSNCCLGSMPGQVGCDNQACYQAIANNEVAPYCVAPLRWGGSCTSYAQIYCCDLCRRSHCDNTFNVLRATESGSSPTLDGVTVMGAEGLTPLGFPYGGGGLFSDGANPKVNNCVFSGNSGTYGAAVFTRYGEPTFTNSTFVENGRGVAVYNTLNDPTVTNCAFVRNRWDGIATEGDKPIVGCSFIENVSGPGLRVSGNPIVRDCTFIGGRNGGLVSDGYPLVVRCGFFGNRGPALNSDRVIVIDTVFSGNAGGEGAAMFADDALLTNNTFGGNSASVVGGLFAFNGATLRNCIFWDNENSGGTQEQAQMGTLGTLWIRYSIVQGWTGALTPGGGVGNSGVDPMFVDPLGADGIAGTEDDDLRLLPGSPAINAGDPNTAGLPATDLDGHPRVLCGRVDIGAYEFGIGDFNCDQSVDLFDFANWSACMTGPHSGPYGAGCEAFDFNADSAIDLSDFYVLQHVFVGE